MNAKVDVYSASDYAGMTVGPWSFYYGYEWGREPDPDEPGEDREVWGFRAKFEERVVADLSVDSLTAAGGLTLDWDDVTTNLLIGIGLCIRNGAFS